MSTGLHSLIAAATPAGAIPVLDREDLAAHLARRAARDVARRAEPGAYVYLILFAMLAWVTGMAQERTASIAVLGVGLAAFTSLRVLRCRAESSAPIDPDGDPRPRSMLRWVVLGQSAVWTTFCIYTIHVHGIDWPSMLVLLCSAATLSGGLFAFAPDLVLSRAFNALMAAPLVAMMLLQGSSPAQATAFFMVLFATVLERMTQIQHREYWRALEGNELLRRHAEALAVARRDAEQASRAKSTFLANMSHELRTPLHGILSYARFGVSRVGRVDDAKLKEYFERIASSGNGLLALFDDLLDLSRMEAGRMSCTPAVQRLQPVLATLVDEFRGRCLEAEVTLELEDVDPHLMAAVDALRFKQVLRNLLANAIRFSPAGGTLRVSTRIDDDTLRLHVDDDGPGIPEGELEAIFEKFVQSSATETGAGGTGLGLTISRQLMVLHGGRLWAENRPAGGARFVAELPRVKDPAPAEPAAV